nr:phospholipase D-like domain-containing protein [uncultured Deefgea sp.]
METQVYFSGIRKEIIQRLDKATERVLVAVAWLTDKSLFDALVSCQRRGVVVSLAVLDDTINRQSSIAWERLTALGGNLYWIPEGTDHHGSLHHKFCLIDTHTVMNGSFNWTYRASRADENMTVFEGDAAIALRFQQEFVRLLSKYGHGPAPVVIDSAKLMARLSIIASLLELAEFDEIPQHINKIANAQGQTDIDSLMQYVQQQDWQAAQEVVRCILSRGTAVTLYLDPLAEALNWQIRLLEMEIIALETSLGEMLRQIHLFDYQQNQAIGDLTREYLEVRWRYLAQLHQRKQQQKTYEDAEAAKKTFHDYQQAQSELAHEAQPIALDAEQQAELKQLYRKLAMQSHPDRVAAHLQEQAKVLFQQLQAAYQNNDLAALQRIKLQIEQGLAPVEQVALSIERLELRMTELQSVQAQLAQQIGALSQTLVWQTLSTHTDWAVWFAEQAERLRTEIANYRAQLEELEAMPI